MSDAPHRGRLEAVPALTAGHRPAVRGDALATFAAAWLRQLGADDLLEHSPAELCGALLCHGQ